MKQIEFINDLIDTLESHVEKLEESGLLKKEILKINQFMGFLEKLKKKYAKLDEDEDKEEDDSKKSISGLEQDGDGILERITDEWKQKEDGMASTEDSTEEKDGDDVLGKLSKDWGL